MKAFRSLFRSWTCRQGRSGLKQPRSQFRILRQALRTVPRRLPTLLISTNARISNFIPPFEKDDSRKDLYDSGITPLKTFLHPPVVILESFDLLSSQLPVFHPDTRIDSYIFSDEYVKDLLTLGRPLWGAFLVNNSVREVLELATAKLRLAKTGIINGPAFFSISETSKNETLNQEVLALQVLGSTGYLPPVTSSTHALDLLQSRMGVLYEFDLINDRLCVGFASEPVLALVSLGTLMSRLEVKAEGCLALIAPF